MILKSKYADFFLRVVVGMVLGVLFGWMIADGAFYLLPQKETVDRQPREVEIVIPFGTSKQVKEGVYNRSIPSDMVFVQGDVLIVRNRDEVDHQLGPLWVPAGTSGVLSLETADMFSYECSFQPTNLMGLDVRPRVDGGTRLQAILAIALPTGMMLAVYSYLIPFKKKQMQATASH